MNAHAEIQVFEGEGTRTATPRKPKPITDWRGRCSFRVDDFPVHFDYRIGTNEQGGRVTNQTIEFFGCGTCFSVDSYAYQGEPLPKFEGFTGTDGKNYAARTWVITKPLLIALFMGEKGGYVRERIAHAKQFRRKRLVP